jgi:sec-independent protein translocase protein TatA
MMPTLGAPELIIILVIIVLIFGVGKLPEVGQALGKGIREFRGAADGTEE